RNGLAPLYGDGARFTAANIASHLGVGAGRSIAAAATRSVIEGTSFGDNIIATLPDVLAQTVVDVVAGVVTGRGGYGNSESGMAIRAAKDAVRGDSLDPP
ncbi:MAG: hypothetical protein ABL909_10500, partial [Sphingopyxis sp.]